MSDQTILELTAEAIEMISSLRDQEPGDGEYGLYLEVTGMRGPEFAYELSFMPVADATDDHLVERYGDLAVMVRSVDVDKLKGSSLTVTDQGLAMNNPNAPASPTIGEGPKGDLSGPLAEQVAQVLTDQVNPAIAMHGGGAELVSVDGTTAYLRLVGGCQGCGLAQVTLKQGIERILLERISDLTGVVDVTDHESGSDPYYQSSKK